MPSQLQKVPRGQVGKASRRPIHEMFGDGIMRAIDFEFDIQHLPDPKGDRVHITYNGKFRRRRERELGDLGQHSAGAGRDAELLAHLGERDVCEREVVDRREVAGALGTPPKAFGEEIGSAVAG
jgi:hypothetical protein